MRILLLVCFISNVISIRVQHYAQSIVPQLGWELVKTFKINEISAESERKIGVIVKLLATGETKCFQLNLVHNPHTHIMSLNGVIPIPPQIECMILAQPLGIPPLIPPPPFFPPPPLIIPPLPWSHPRPLGFDLGSHFGGPIVPPLPYNHLGHQSLHNNAMSFGGKSYNKPFISKPLDPSYSIPYERTPELEKIVNGANLQVGSSSMPISVPRSHTPVTKPPNQESIHNSNRYQYPPMGPPFPYLCMPPSRPVFHNDRRPSMPMPPYEAGAHYIQPSMPMPSYEAGANQFQPSMPLPSYVASANQIQPHVRPSGPESNIDSRPIEQRPRPPSTPEAGSDYKPSNLATKPRPPSYQSSQEKTEYRPKEETSYNAVPSRPQETKPSEPSPSSGENLNVPTGEERYFMPSPGYLRRFPWLAVGN